MKIKEIVESISGLTAYGNKNIQVLGMASHAAKVGPGFLYVAKRGTTFDGNRFVPEAVANGAVCLLTDLYDPSLAIPQLIASDVPACEAQIADLFYGSPSKKLHLVGVTGTSGKTTTTYVLKDLFDHFGLPCGLIGTVSYIAGPLECAATNTTPDIITNQGLLAEMVRYSMKACAMEVSSHALEQGRVDGLVFTTAIFTNLTHEHLDYHGTMQQYAASKSRLFKTMSPSCVAIVPCDDPWVSTILEGTKARVVTVGFSSKADVSASEIVLGRTTSFMLSYQNQTVPVEIPLIGRFNVGNVLAAAAVFLAHGYSLESIAEALRTVKAPPGRLEKVPNDLGLSIYVDYAHKEDALRKVLPTVRDCTKGRLITVFGCGGDRDRLKRPLMGRAVQELSDIAIVTSDNPRSEDPLKIIEEIVAGFSVNNYYIEPDREAAILQAVRLAKADDSIVIAGKGHEKQQIFATTVLPFDDVAIARRCCSLVSSTGGL